MKKFSIHSDGKNYVELGAPLKVYYDITNRCNLNCVFCFKGRDDYDVKKVELIGILNKIADAGIPDVVFIGGEPLYSRFIFEALDYANSIGLRCGIITNGTLFTETNVPLLKLYVNNSISVSLHAPNDELHDKISCGHHTYSKIVEGLKLLNRYDIVPEISFTPVQDNVDFLYETIDSIMKAGIKISDVLVNRLIPSGNALHKWEDKKVGLDDQTKLLEQMFKLSIKYPELCITSGDAIPFCVVEEKYRKFITRCDYAITLGWINEKKQFGKCMVRGGAGIPSINNTTIKTLWRNSNAFLEHRHMKNLKEECKQCDWVMLCGGGCACSSPDKGCEDAFLLTGKRYTMPPLSMSFDLEIPVSEDDFNEIDNNKKYHMLNPFFIRNEHLSDLETEENYLLLPNSAGAVIQDVITSDNGEILWINAVEKQIVLYMQIMESVNDIIKAITYEFGYSRSFSEKCVKETIARLVILKMAGVS